MIETGYICVTCGVQHAPSKTPPAHCAICEDERQYVNPEGQAWTTLETLRQTHEGDWRELEPGLFGIGATPAIAIGQRALFLPRPGGGVMWDCTPLVTEPLVAEIKARGGLRAIAISHPHFYGAMIEWSRAFGDVPIYLHEDCRDFVMRPSKNIHFWSGAIHDLDTGIKLIRCGGHFSGSSVLHWASLEDGPALFTGDTIMVTPDPRWMSFMRSYPNLIPLNARAVKRILDALAPYPFERAYGAWWAQVCKADAYHRLFVSGARYLQAIRD